MKAPYLLEAKNICFSFQNRKILDNFNLAIKKGEIHCLLGEKDSGKSTFVKIIGGVYPYQSYSGEIFFNGNPVKFSSQKDSEAAGIGVVYQNFKLIPQFSVCENIFLASEFEFMGVINWRKAFERAQSLFKELGFNIFPGNIVSELNNWEKQIVKVARALAKNPLLVVFDDVTSELSENEGESFLQIIRQLKLKKGLTVLFISHRTNEVFDIADRVSVLRGGKIVISEDMQNADEDIIVRKMTGRDFVTIESDDNFWRSFGITEREKEIISLLLKGFNNREISDKLFISLNTVKTHIYSIYQKTNVNNRLELANLIKEKKTNKNNEI